MCLGRRCFAALFLFPVLLARDGLRPSGLLARLKSAVVNAAGFTPAAMAARAAGPLSGFCASKLESGFTMICLS
jgi:hypothetical protein